MSHAGGPKGRTSCEKLGRFAESVRAERVSPELVHQGARSFLDTFGITIAAREEPCSRIVMDYATAGRCGGPSTLWATGQRVQPEDAALAHGVMSHALDYDHVTAKPPRGHPAVVQWPALIALGETVGATGAQLSAAFAVAYEFYMKLPHERIFEHYARGHHSTSTLGVLAGAAACANLLGLDAARATAAVGIAVSHAGGVQANFGTMSKPIQPGNAAAAAIRCAQLAARGFTASLDAIDSRQGFAGAYGMGEGLSASLDGLGEEPLELVRSGFSVKRFPACYSVHRPVQGVLDMIAERPIPPSEVEGVQVTVGPRDLKALIHHRPTAGLEGKFSMEYAVAAALLDGKVGLRSFTDAAVQRPEAQALLRKVESHEEGGEPLPLRATVVVKLRSGEERSIRTVDLRGSLKLPLTDAELEAKFRDCVDFSGLKLDVDGFLAAVWKWHDRPIQSILEFVPKM